MKHICLIIITLFTFFVCQSQSKRKSKSKPKTVKKVIKNAKSFLGTKYRYGGTSKQGMDCSGLIYVSFKKEKIKLPRTSSEQSKKGKKIKLKKVKKGDLLFFKTGKKNRISHVGIVVNSSAKGIKFIHTSNSLGVTISSLNERYWSKAFKFAKRVIR